MAARFAHRLIVSLALCMGAGAYAAAMRGRGYEMSGVFDRGQSGSLHIITIDPVADRFFAAVEIGAPGCMGAVTGFAIATSKTAMTLTPLADDASSKECRIEVTFSPNLKRATVSEDHCMDWHGMRCGFDGTYSKVHD